MTFEFRVLWGKVLVTISMTAHLCVRIMTSIEPNHRSTTTPCGYPIQSEQHDMMRKILQTKWSRTVLAPTKLLLHGVLVAASFAEHAEQVQVVGCCSPILDEAQVGVL